MESPVAFSPASITVDRTSPVPLYYQVAQVLEQAIEAGELTPGQRLDNEIALAESLGLSRPTMRRAIQYLVDRGLLVRKRGVGTQVVHRAVRRPIELTSLYDDLATEGRDPRTDVLRLEEIPASDNLAHVLGVPEGTAVLALERLRYADDAPLAVLRNYLPSGLVTLTAGPARQRSLPDDAVGRHPVAPGVADDRRAPGHRRRGQDAGRAARRVAAHHAPHRVRRDRAGRRVRRPHLPGVGLFLRVRPGQSLIFCFRGGPDHEAWAGWCRAHRRVPRGDPSAVG
jgi:DNA-binding GntR family transcriptional regulator